jgi:hypothetical protein
MKRQTIRRIGVFSTVLLSIAAAAATAQTVSVSAPSVPRLEGETLSGRKIVLPEDAHGKFALLAIGFSRKSGDVTRAWGDRFKKDFGADPRFAVYPVAELEGAPRFVRGMIVGSMKKGTPVADQDHFVTLFQGTEELKRAVGFSAGDDAYLLLLPMLLALWCGAAMVFLAKWATPRCKPRRRN